MAERPRLIDVTELALEARLPIEWTETGVATWLRSSPTTPSISVYFTQLLYDRLRRSDAKADLRANALRVLGHAKEALVERVIGQHAWRTWMQVELGGAVEQLWLIVDHGHSDGIAIGFGPGDFW
ncbi:MAG TPA: hypothetical protein PK954_22500 [Anaerolineales bacterium]|nr:hypothetical protein [Anaerolineales bacterium]HRF48732.1 hypothetical protein [Anaerolineales bacterium]